MTLLLLELRFSGVQDWLTLPDLSVERAARESTTV
jgi:hypothetical protein